MVSNFNPQMSLDTENELCIYLFLDLGFYVTKTPGRASCMLYILHQQTDFNRFTWK